MKELLTCEGLTKSYQKGTNALDDIELHIGFGRIVGLLGPNGSGKTTLIKLANGLLQPTAGSIKIAGMAPGPDTKAIVSYLPDAAWLPDWMRVEQLVEMFRDFYADFDPAKANEMLEKLELSPKAPLKSLSKGNKEKVQLILAMSRNARLYLLDGHNCVISHELLIITWCFCKFLCFDEITRLSDKVGFNLKCAVIYRTHNTLS